MGFYEELSKVYDIVFQMDEVTVNFLKKGLVGKSEILDLGCGTGTEAIELAKDGHHVVGIDLDKDMIEIAKGKSGSNPVEFYCEDMMNFRNITKDKLFDRIYCIGNSLVHLKDKDKVKEFIETICSSLKKEGCLIIQIINYDRIIDYEITHLPTIDRSSQGIKFIRNYCKGIDKNTIHFETELIINRDGACKAYKNSVRLLALRSNEIIEIIKDSGFSNLELYGNFNEAVFNKDSYALIIKCLK